jgi:phage baseplate assembly protein W
MTIHGMSKADGTALAGFEHVRQSVWDILTTPVGSRVMRRDYGSRVPELIDKPMTPPVIIDVFVAAAEAIIRWEPRFRPTQMSVETANAAGQLGLSIRGRWFHRWPDTSETRDVEVLI